MSVSIERITAAIRIADQALYNTQFQQDVLNWTEIRNVLLAARDELNKPAIPAAIAEQVKIDGRTKEARAAKAAAQ